MEILYYCVPLSEDVKFAGGKRLNWRESKATKSFTKKDFQIGTMERMEEIVNDIGTGNVRYTGLLTRDELDSSEGILTCALYLWTRGD